MCCVGDPLPPPHIYLHLQYWTLRFVYHLTSLSLSHIRRAKEMQETQAKAIELTNMGEGKHHIGDFLPPDELARFMEKVQTPEYTFSIDIYAVISSIIYSLHRHHRLHFCLHSTAPSRKAATPTSPTTRTTSWPRRTLDIVCWRVWAGRRAWDWGQRARVSQHQSTS